MNKSKNLHYYIHNIKVSVNCPQGKTRKFIENSFFFFNKIQKYKFQIIINIDLYKKKSFANLGEEINKIGNHALLNDNTLVFQNHGLIYLIKKKRKKYFYNCK